MLAASICSASTDVGNPTSASASATALFHLWCLENRICVVFDLITTLIREGLFHKYLVVCDMVSRGRASRGNQGSLAPSEGLQGSFGEHVGSLSSLHRPGRTLLHFTSCTSARRACATVSWLNDLDEERSNNGSVGCAACGIATGNKESASAVDFASQVMGQLGGI